MNKDSKNQLENTMNPLTESSDIQPQISHLLTQGIDFHKNGQLLNAQEVYEQILKIQPNHFDALQLLATAHSQSGNYSTAANLFQQALQINKTNSAVFNNYANALHKLKKLGDAVENYNQATELKPDYAEAYYNRAVVQQELKRIDLAIIDLTRAMSLNPECENLLGTLLHSKMQICDWSEFENSVSELVKKTKEGKRVSTTFPLLALIDSPQIHQISARIFSQSRYLESAALGQITKRNNTGKIRIGYFSADLRNHAVACLTAELFEMHNKDEFETIAFSFGPNDHSEIRIRISQSFNEFIDVSHLGDREIALLARQKQIDIAVDLGGYTTDFRTGIFAYRAAPIQISYIGYLGTMGNNFIDYLIADKTLIPSSAKQFYSEKIVYLPSYQVNDSKRTISDKAFTRQELGLPKKGFVFCCFNNNYKIVPTTFDGWMRILKSVEGSVLFLFADNEWAKTNLKKEAQSRGIHSDRIIFGDRIPRDEYLARYRSCDLFLDTLPYNAGTTASDALWAGLPVLTLMGSSFASRIAASLLNAIDLPELITTTQSEYEAFAIELATNPQKLVSIKQKLVNNQSTTALFNTKFFTKNIEAAYKIMMERYCNDLSAEDIEI